MNRFASLLPLWGRNYPKQHFSADLIAGIVVTVLVLPQSLAYAMLAGLPPQVGLYVSILPVVAYALIGSSMTQAVGPVAITSIMTYALLSPLAEAGSAHYLALAAALALMSGALVLAFGVMRLGFLANLLSRPVVSGFIAGSALLILVSQLKLLLGVAVPRGSTWEQLHAVAGQVLHTNGPTLLLSAASIVLLQLARRRTGLLPRLAPLVLIVFATLLVITLDLDRRHGVAEVGEVASGLPALQLSLPALGDIGTLLLPALVLAFIGTVQNITMARALAMKRRERVDANQELVGLGLSNVMASFFGGMPVGGGMSRSAINVASGAQTPLASIVSALLMLGIVAVGTTAFARIPLPVLAASIVVAALGMIDVAEFRRAWAYDRADALATLLYRASTPHIAVVGRIVGTEHFRNVERHGVETLTSAVCLRIDESLFFGNLSAIEGRLLSELDQAPQARAVVLIMSAVNRVDLTALEALTTLEQDLQERGVVLHPAEIKGPVQDRMLHTSFWSQLQGRVHLSANAAFESLKPD